ncbi:MAG: hypothetical protein Q4B50_08570 [Bacillota bacterium]|nr:hypothetical protein [Bacillota bacterium]
MTENETIHSTSKPQLTDVINFETDIAPHPLVSIWAGVGAGKNYFVEQMVTGSEQYRIPKMNVLIITSRKAKVAETLSKNASSITRIIDDDKTLDDIFFNIGCDPRDYRRTIKDSIDCEMNIYQRSVVCSNAFIEKYLKYRHHPLQPETHLWNRFDMIVWDEAHALHTDSSYQSAPYHVMMLMKETYKRIKAADENETLPEEKCNPDIKRPICKHLIFMSGTPEAIATIPIFQKYPVLDMRKDCICVMPKNIHFLTSEQATRLIQEQLQQEERIVYFLNHTLLPKALSERFQIPVKKLPYPFPRKICARL